MECEWRLQSSCSMRHKQDWIVVLHTELIHMLIVDRLDNLCFVGEKYSYCMGRFEDLCSMLFVQIVWTVNILCSWNVGIYFCLAIWSLKSQVERRSMFWSMTGQFLNDNVKQCVWFVCDCHCVYFDFMKMICI